MPGICDGLGQFGQCLRSRREGTGAVTDQTDMPFRYGFLQGYFKHFTVLQGRLRKPAGQKAEPDIMGDKGKDLIRRGGFNRRLVNQSVGFKQPFIKGIGSGMRRKTDQRIAFQIMK
jgi:hypothetical protein